MTAPILKDDILRCLLCCEVFNDPVSLQCCHIFCRACLGNFVQTAEGVAKARGIPCPACGQITPVTNTKQPVSEWVGQVQTNVYIASLVNALDSKEKDCSVCETDGKSVKATAWCDQCDSAFCDNCQSFHSKAPFSKAHNVTEISSKSLQSFQPRGQRFCQDHKEISMECFCKDCNVLVCSACLIIKHRKCDNVMTVSEVVKNRKSELEKQQDILTSELEKVQEKLSEIKEVKVDLYKRQEKIEVTIKDTADKIVTDIREKEKDLLQELKEISETEIKQIEKDMRTLENIIKATHQSLQLAKEMKTSGSDCDLIFHQKDISQTTCNVQDISVRLVELEFTSNLPEIQEKFGKLTLGELSINKHLELKSPFHTRIKEDGKEPDLKDITVLKRKGITVTVVTDWINKCVKCFYIKHFETCNSRVDVGGQPWSVTKLSRDMIAVSIWGQNKISLITVTPDLKYHSTINTKTWYWGLAAINQNTLAAGSPDTHSIDKIDLTGRILASVTTDLLGKNVLFWPNYLCISPTSDIIISDLSKKNLTGQSQKGDVRFKYQPGRRELDCPRGVSCDQSGDVFVVDGNLHKVVKVTGDGSFVQNTLTSRNGLKSPSSVCYHDNLLYVIQNGEIRVFRLN